MANSTGKYSSESGDDSVCWSDGCHHSGKLHYVVYMKIWAKKYSKQYRNASLDKDF